MTETTPRRIAVRVAALALVIAGAVGADSLLTALTGCLPVPLGGLAGAAGTLLLLGVTFSTFERIAPEQQVIRSTRRRERRADIAYWFLGFASRFAADVATTITLVVVLGRLPAHTVGFVSSQPVWVQIPEALLLGDLVQYWIHRFLHGRRLWAIHAIHHSSEDLNWLSTTRIHPLETLLKGPVEMVPLYLLGFSNVATLPVITAILGIYEIYLHANVGWRYGMLRFVIASPAFHRWHHAADRAAFNKDFAGLFPIYDVIFGTYYLPAHAPSAYGLGRGQRISPLLWRQLANPARTAISRAA